MHTSRGQVRLNQIVNISCQFRVRCVINSRVVLLVGPHLPPPLPSSSAPPRILTPPPLWSSSSSLCSAQLDKPPHPAVRSLILRRPSTRPLIPSCSFHGSCLCLHSKLDICWAGSWVVIRLSCDLMFFFSPWWIANIDRKGGVLFCPVRSVSLSS